MVSPREIIDADFPLLFAEIMVGDKITERKMISIKDDQIEVYFDAGLL